VISFTFQTRQDMALATCTSNENHCLIAVSISH